MTISEKACKGILLGMSVAEKIAYLDKARADDAEHFAHCVAEWWPQIHAGFAMTISEKAAHEIDILVIQTINEIVKHITFEEDDGLCVGGAALNHLRDAFKSVISLHQHPTRAALAIEACEAIDQLAKLDEATGDRDLWAPDYEHAIECARKALAAAPPAPPLHDDPTRESIKQAAKDAHANFMATGRDRESDECWDDIAAAILALLPVAPSGWHPDLDAERKAIAAETRRYASHYYPAHSDGRYTFVMLADWIDARSALLAEQPAPPLHQLAGGTIESRAGIEQEARTLDHLVWLLENDRVTIDSSERKEIAAALRELAAAYRSGNLLPLIAEKDPRT